MSIFSGIVTDDGPLLDVILMVTVPRQNALRRNNMDVPMPVAARLLIEAAPDTQIKPPARMSASPSEQVENTHG